jgi:AraC family transcriptional activator of pobA
VLPTGWGRSSFEREAKRIGRVVEAIAFLTRNTFPAFPALRRSKPTFSSIGFRDGMDMAAGTDYLDFSTAFSIRRAQIGMIPTFYLYGEPHRTIADDFLHAEGLDLRSRPAGWTIRPHSHRELNHIMVLTEGGGVMQADSTETPFEAPCLLIVPARTVHGFRWQDESRGYVITFANTQRDALIHREPDVADLFAAPGIAALDAEVASAVSDHARVIMRELGWAASGHRTAIEASLMSVIVHALRSRALSAEGARAAPGRHAAIVARYRALVEERFRLREPVEVYTDRLGVSATTLRIACARVAGRSPGRILNMRAMLEAKRALCYTNLSVGQIAYSLGFSDPAYFTRMFAQMAGCSPRSFRHSRHAVSQENEVPADV